MVGIVFAVDRASNGGEVLGQVSVADRQLGGLDKDSARAELRTLEEDLAGRPLQITVAGTRFEIEPTAIGFDLDGEAMLAEAMTHGREGGIPSQFSWWVGNLRSADGLRLEIPYSFDPDALRSILADWEVDGIADPAYEGNVELVDGEPVITPPRPGTGIDLDAAVDLIGGSLLDGGRSPIDLPTRLLDPVTTVADLEAVAAEAESLMDGEIRLVNPAYRAEVVIPQDVVTSAVGITRYESGPLPSYQVIWADAPIRDYVEPRLARYTTEPVDGELIIDDEARQVRLIPSVNAREADVLAVLAEARRVAATPERFGLIPFRDGREPEVTTEDLEGLGIREVIGEFTTDHNCCENRVVNIQLIADAVDGAVVLPGETWSLNEHVGERTAAKGYLPAGAIIKGELYCCDDPINIGGGTSQFTTTLYNAIFFAGLEDVSHTPHTIYFSRYPEGREATLGFPEPDLVFRNNTGNAVVIRTSHTDTSITARIYGDNGGLVVEAGLSDRYDFTGIRERFEADPSVPPGAREVRTAGSGGWAVDVFRYLTTPDGETTEQKWTWRYIGEYRVILVNPCTLANNCPEPEPDPPPEDPPPEEPPPEEPPPDDGD
jgi:vancomycin resistance protein YoaR